MFVISYEDLKTRAMKLRYTWLDRSFPARPLCASWGPSNFHASRATWNWWMPLLQCRDEIEVRNAGSCRPSRLAACLCCYTGALILSPDPASGSFGVDNDVQHHSPGQPPVFLHLFLIQLGSFEGANWTYRPSWIWKVHSLHICFSPAPAALHTLARAEWALDLDSLRC